MVPNYVVDRAGPSSAAEAAPRTRESGVEHGGRCMLPSGTVEHVAGRRVAAHQVGRVAPALCAIVGNAEARRGEPQKEIVGNTHAKNK